MSPELGQAYIDAQGGEHTGTKRNGNSMGTLQLGARGNQRANSAKQVGRDKAAAPPPATDVVWVLGEAHAKR